MSLREIQELGREISELKISELKIPVEKRRKRQKKVISFLMVLHRDGRAKYCRLCDLKWREVRSRQMAIKEINRIKKNFIRTAPIKIIKCSSLVEKLNPKFDGKAVLISFKFKRYITV